MHYTCHACLGDQVLYLISSVLTLFILRPNEYSVSSPSINGRWQVPFYIFVFFDFSTLLTLSKSNIKLFIYYSRIEAALCYGSPWDTLPLVSNFFFISSFSKQTSVTENVLTFKYWQKLPLWDTKCVMLWPFSRRERTGCRLVSSS